MKILWFANTSSRYKSSSVGYNGGGWISSLESELLKCHSDVELAVAFYAKGQPFRVVQGRSTYYPITLNRGLVGRFRRAFSAPYQEISNIDAFKAVIDDFKPDVIHIFGSEQPFGLVCEHTDIPTVIHIQGLLIPYLNAYFPPGYSKWDVYMSSGLGLINIIKEYRQYQGWVRSADREKRIFASCKNIMGRNEWDRRLTRIYSPASKYYHCGEMMRDTFYSQPNRSNGKNERLKIVSTISSPLYKGADMILKTARILKEELKLDFEWSVYGIGSLGFSSDKTKISAPSVSVVPRGIVSSDDLKFALENCDVYMHPTYIDGSTNSVCEAQLLGVPVVACNVGGLAGLIDHLKTGFLVPANDPFMAASYIDELSKNAELASRIAVGARETAMKRHDKNQILGDLLDIYEDMQR